MQSTAALCCSRRVGVAASRQRSYSWFGSFFDTRNSSNIDDDGDKKERQEQDELKQAAAHELHDRTLYRFSIQHGHPLGPWQAILKATQTHHMTWTNDNIERYKSTTSTITSIESNSDIAAADDDDDDDGTEEPVLDRPIFRVLDLACGPRGEPGRTIANALPFSEVTCTDSCSEAIAAVLVVADDVTTTTNEATTIEIKTIKTSIAAAIPVKSHTSSDNDTYLDSNEFYNNKGPSPLPTPKNLTKAVLDLADLSAYDSNTFHVITCCYGYGCLSSDTDVVALAMAEAHRVLVPGGKLIIATWDRPSPLVMVGRDILASVRAGGRNVHAGADDDDAFLPPRISTPPIMELSGEGEVEGLLVQAGFNEPGAVVTSWGTYPFDLGSRPGDQFAMGTILIRPELESLGALIPYNTNSNGELPAHSGWNNLAEEVFWINVPNYTSTIDDNLFLTGNRFKLTVSSKKDH